MHYLRQNLAVLPNSVPDDLILDLVAATPAEVYEVAPALGRVDRDPQLVQLGRSIALYLHLRRGRLSSLSHCNRVYLFATNYRLIIVFWIYLQNYLFFSLTLVEATKYHLLNDSLKTH